MTLVNTRGQINKKLAAKSHMFIVIIFLIICIIRVIDKSEDGVLCIHLSVNSTLIVDENETSDNTAIVCNEICFCD